jgi:pimeloyl-ACP methyl ester carboxylesterase
MHTSRPWVDIDAAGHMLRQRDDGRWEPNWDARLARAIVAQLNHPDPAWWQRLPEIRVPTLMLLASRSHVPAEKTRAAAALIPDCRLLEFESGHTIHLEAPGAFVAALQDFL